MSAVVHDRRMPRAGRASAFARSLRERGMGATLLVAAISSGFGVVLLGTTDLLAAYLSASDYIGFSETLAVVSGILSVLLVAVAVYVAAIVTANTFATVVAGSTRSIALHRLIGASASSQRRALALRGLAVGALGAAVGLAAGVGLVAVLLPLTELMLDADLGLSAFRPVLLVPAAIVALTTWAAAWAGSRRVLEVTPLEALAGSVERTTDEVARHRVRHVVAIALFIGGAVLLALGVFVGFVTPLGVVVAFLGGVASFTGLSLGATLVMPRLLALTGRAFGGSVAARLAAANALRHPERSSRMAIGVVMGVTLVTMFAVATESAKQLIAASGGGELPDEMALLLDSFSAVMSGLVAISAVIAAVGLVNLLSLGVVQRRRELGLLRSLGLGADDVRRMVLLEAVHLTVTALAAGLVLGTVYGWIAAQSLFGSVRIPPLWLSPTFVLPAVPPGPILAVVLATAVLTLVAAWTPTRLATRVSPVEALAEP